MVLLGGVAFAAKGHPAHLPAESVHHEIAFALAIEVRVPKNSRLRKLQRAAIGHNSLTEQLYR